MKRLHHYSFADGVISSYSLDSLREKVQLYINGLAKTSHRTALSFHGTYIDGYIDSVNYYTTVRIVSINPRTYVVKFLYLR